MVPPLSVRAVVLLVVGCVWVCALRFCLRKAVQCNPVCCAVLTTTTATTNTSAAVVMVKM